MPDEKYTAVSTSEPKDTPPTNDSGSTRHGASKSISSIKGPLPRGPFPLDIPVLQHLKGKRIILASASPRRKQILASIGLTNLEIIPSPLPENLSKEHLGPFDYVLQTAIQKCLSVYTHCLDNSLASIPDPSLVIAADTVIVTTSGHILEKPRSQAEHIRMLKRLRDEKSHKVFTAIAILAPREDARYPGYNCENEVVETTVVFDTNLGDELIEAYVKTREGVDKAGGYAIQGMGAMLVERIEGSWDNVVGLPIRNAVAMMEKAVFDQEDLDPEENEEGDEEDDD
ncbi:a8493e03-8be3-408b-a30c-3a3de72809a4 [Sclerotinia trifoliorum]|uniref:A8493e03-8be3-408b-a30c-3a3de72809a4 n=1 Tax=Sclerotinia trifoliorum TaxID=28548 RepID=A0A8H2VWH0_9HELO|nr:a8493e03-8be3-408b-a30c-3a3de72809a4 [Sclerotinia trifoliorum]